MKKTFILLALFLSVFSSCSDKNNEITEAEVKINIQNGEIISPSWLKEIINEQSVKGSNREIFPGSLYKVTIEKTEYLVLTNLISSNSCVAVQVFHLSDGSPISCEEEIHHLLFTRGCKAFPYELIWDGFSN